MTLGGLVQRKVIIATILSIFLLMSTSQAAHADEYVHLGTFGNDANDPNGYGAASKISQPGLSPNYGTDANIWKYYWVGITYPDGTFYQVGWADPSADATCAGLMNFVTKKVNGRYFTNMGQCGLTGTRTFGMVPVSTSGGTSTWAAQMDNQELYGNRLTAPSYFKSNQAVIVSEAGTSNSFSSRPSLPSVTYSPAVHVKFGNGAWGPQAAGKVYRANGGIFSTPCGPYYITGLGGSSVRIQSGTSGNCLQDGAKAW